MKHKEAEPLCTPREERSGASSLVLSRWGIIFLLVFSSCFRFRRVRAPSERREDDHEHHFFLSWHVTRTRIQNQVQKDGVLKF